MASKTAMAMALASAQNHGWLLKRCCQESGKALAVGGIYGLSG
jgi:hypothetical protein